MKKQKAKSKLRRQRPVHKKVLLHPATVFMLLCTGVLLAGWTVRSFAESYDVTGTVKAPVPTSAAEITSPADQARFTTTPILVSGTCPSNTYAKLYRNDIFSGVANCGNGVTTWQIETDLSLGSNVLYTRVFNVTDDEGPQSARITVWYDQPAASTPSAASGTGTSHKPVAASDKSSVFYIESDYRYKVYDVGKPVTWELSIKGGVRPYALTINWGDGSQSTIARDDRSPFKVEHTYNSVSPKGDYKVRITAVDNDGAKAFLELIVLVRAPVASGVASGGGGSLLSNISQWLWLAWPTYLALVLMAISFWLGERQQLLILTHRRSKHRRHTRRAA